MSTVKTKVNYKVRMLALLLVMTTSLMGLSGCLGVTGSKTIELTPTVFTPTIVREGTLIVGVNSNHAPYAGKAKASNSDSLIGIDVDVAAALADQMGLKLELVDVATENPNELLQSGAVDMIMDISNEGNSLSQAKTIGPYLITGPALFMLVKNDSVPEVDLSTLNGATIKVQEKSTSSGAIRELYGEASLDPVANFSDAFDAVQNGSATYAAADAVLGSYMADGFEDVSCVTLLPDWSQGGSKGVYIGINRDNTELADVLTNALRKIHENGVLWVILSKWFGSVSSTVIFSTEAIISQDTTGAPTIGTEEGETEILSNETNEGTEDNAEDSTEDGTEGDMGDGAEGDTGDGMEDDPENIGEEEPEDGIPNPSTA